MPVVSTQRQLNAYQLAQQQKVAAAQEQAAGYPNQSTGPAISGGGALSTNGNTGFNLGGDTVNPFSSTQTPKFGGDAGDFLSALYTSRPQFVQQQQQLLSTLGPSSRQAIFAASPELAQASQYYNQAFNDPYGGQLNTFTEALRGAQAARGFGNAGGSGPAGEEARYLTNYAAQQKERLAPQLAQFGQGLLNIAGLGGPPDITLGALGTLAFQNRTLNETIAANKEASEYAKKMYEQSQMAPSNPFGSKSGGTSSPYGGGGSVSSTVGGTTSGVLSTAKNPYIGGGGTADFFSRQSAEVAPTYFTPYVPAATDSLYEKRLRYAQGLEGNVDPAKGFGFI